MDLELFRQYHRTSTGFKSRLLLGHSKSSIWFFFFQPIEGRLTGLSISISTYLTSLCWSLNHNLSFAEDFPVARRISVAISYYILMQKSSLRPSYYRFDCNVIIIFFYNAVLFLQTWWAGRTFHFFLFTPQNISPKILRIIQMSCSRWAICPSVVFRLEWWVLTLTEPSGACCVLDALLGFFWPLG